MLLAYLKKHPEAAATVVLGLAVIQNTHLTQSETTKQLASQIEAANLKLEMKLGAKMEVIRHDIKQESGNTQGIALGTAYACLKGLSGESEMVPTWISHIDTCVKSGVTTCEAVKNIPTEHANQVTVKK